MSGSRVVYRCPGLSSQKGHAIFRDFVALKLQEFGASSGKAGDQFGYSVAVSGDSIVVGAPYWGGSSAQDAGAVYLFRIQESDPPLKHESDSRRRCEPTAWH